MTEQELAERLEFWHKHPALAHLGISHWEIEFRVEVLDDSLAEIRCRGPYDSAILTFDPALLHDSIREIDRAIVHELLHIVERDLSSAVREMYDHLAPDLADAYRSQVLHEREGQIDRLSRTIVALANVSV